MFCGDKKDLFTEIRMVLREVSNQISINLGVYILQILPIDTYTIAELSKRALIEHPWMQYCAVGTTNKFQFYIAKFSAY